MNVLDLWIDLFVYLFIYFTAIISPGKISISGAGLAERGGKSRAPPEQVGLDEFITITDSAKVKNLAEPEVRLQVELN